MCAVTQHQCTAALFRAKCSPLCSVLLCKTSSQHACVTAIAPMDIWSSYMCAVTQHQCTAALFRAKCSPLCSVLLCKTSSQHACVTAIAPMKICCSYKCAVTQHQCSAALPRAKCIPHCSVLLCKTSSHLQHRSGQNVFPTVQCCSVKEAHSMLVALQLHL